MDEPETGGWSEPEMGQGRCLACWNRETGSRERADRR